MNKLFIAALIALTMMLQSATLHARSATLEKELGETVQFVTKVDTNKRIIYMGQNELAYNSLTEFYNNAGEKVSVENLVKNRPIKYKVDFNKPYLHRPVAIKVWIK